jgi:hypothetical protein
MVQDEELLGYQVSREIAREDGDWLWPVFTSGRLGEDMSQRGG